MKPLHNNLERIEDGLDRQNIATIRKRFLRVNSDRLERLRGALSDRQQIFMDALPLLFHFNHPAMPGFVSRETPSCVSHFKPSKHDILVGRTVARSFVANMDPSTEQQIFSIYIMGSVGTIAQSESSDLDIWLCYKPGLSKELLDELHEKCVGISRWATRMRLETHFFLMDHEAFQTEKFCALDAESSGSAQQLLLLDEFYRSAIFIVGRTPIWWHVPEHAESTFTEYTNTLLYNRFIPTDSVIDFGGVAEIPPGEFLGAGIWQLYKAIESPYKSVLKLLLLEAYVAEYPNIEPLSLTFKLMVYEGETNIDELDSYVMIYRRIEKYLIKHDQTHRLDLARKCLYFKVNKPLSKVPKQVAKSWQRLRMEALTKEWHWSDEYICYLDSRAQWKAAEVSNEFQLLVDELNHCYRFLLKFAKNHGKSRAISRNELLLLGRKLQAAFDIRPGKINFVNPGISNNIREDNISISHINIKHEKKGEPELVWTAFSHEPGAALSNNGKALRSHENLLELLLWCHCNGVIDSKTQVDIEDASVFDQAEVKRLITSFKDWLPLPISSADHLNFQQSSSPQAVLFLINAGKAANGQLEHDGYQRMSDKADALRYGGSAVNLVNSVDIVVKNNWNEISISHFNGDAALLDAICEYLQMTLPGTHQRSPEITVSCISNAHTNTIQQRAEKWISDIRLCFFSGKHAKHKRFVFQLAEKYCCLQFKGMKPTLTSFVSQKHLIEHLELEQHSYSPLTIDSMALLGHPLHLVTQYSRPNTVDVFFRQREAGIEIYLVDEFGSIAHNLLRTRQIRSPLKPLSEFLRSSLARQTLVNPEINADFGRLPLNFFELNIDSRGRMHCQSRAVVSELCDERALDIKAIARRKDGDNLAYDFICEGQEFSAEDFGEQIALVICRFIIERRKTKENYPIYISDLDLSAVADLVSNTGHLQIVHYYRIKNRLEAQLNKATGILLSA